ncbi:MBL fold metallo-hydrolase [Mariniluteicoccus endophyticus]
MGLHHVEPGGEPHVETLAGGLTLTKFSVAPMDNNVYLVSDSAGTVLVDAANDAARIIEVLAGRQVSTIVTTHRHPDHLKALAEIAGKTGARTVCGGPDADAIADETGVRCDTVWTGDTISLPGGGSLEVVGIVGHTPGSITLVLRPEEGPVHLLTGDSLFPGGVGKTWGDGDFVRLLGDVEENIFAMYADDTLVHPGHGDSTTLGDERPHLGEWRTRGY